MTFHNQEGYPAAVSGGTWAMMEPEALDDVKRFGFNLYNTANNHSGDYGQEGVLATIRHLKERDMYSPEPDVIWQRLLKPAIWRPERQGLH